MSYLVRWKPAAERQLARIWTDATDKSAVTRAADTFDAAIERSPTNVGESRPGRTRIAYNRPLGFLFDVYVESLESPFGEYAVDRLIWPGLAINSVDGRGR